MLLPRLQGRVRAWRRTSHKLGRPDDPLGGAPLTNWGKLSRNRTGEGQRQHRDFEGERKGFEGWLARNRRAPAKLHRGSKGTGLEGMGGRGPSCKPKTRQWGEPFPQSQKKFGSRVRESQSMRSTNVRRRRSILAKEKAIPQSALDGGNLGKFSTEPFQNAAKCSSPSALFKHVISISSLNGLARKPTAPDASACARAFSPGKAVTKMIGK